MLVWTLDTIIDVIGVAITLILILICGVVILTENVKEKYKRRKHKKNGGKGVM